MTPISTDQYERVCFACGACTSKPWVSLTDDEAYQLLVDYCDDDLGLLNAIEAKLKEKNT